MKEEIYGRFIHNTEVLTIDNYLKQGFYINNEYNIEGQIYYQLLRNDDYFIEHEVSKDGLNGING